MRLTCTIPAAQTSYEIVIRSGILEDQQTLLEISGLGSCVVIISDETVASLYGHTLNQVLSFLNIESYLLTFPSGEINKNRQTKEMLEDQMFEKRFGRDTCVIALGGGVVTDLVGYIASTYCRGVPLVMIPTSLLAMVDASIGGKTGVNVPYGKNLIGSFYQPKRVIIDSSVLKSLPLSEIQNGVVEMIKHGLIADSKYFEFFEIHSKEILALESPWIEQAIFESCRIKQQIVEQDEKEGGIRHLLNFGHTVGHALENLSQYTIPHGQAVAIGICVESHMAVELGILPKIALEKMIKVFKLYGQQLRVEVKYSSDEIFAAMRLDKKSQKRNPRFVMLQDIGSPRVDGREYSFTVEENLIKNALNWMNYDLYCY